MRLEPERALVVLVGEDGQVENRVVNLPAGMPTSALTEAGNFLNARIRGKTLSEARTEMEQARAAAQAELDQLTQKVIDDGLASWSGGEERQLISAWPGPSARRPQGAGRTWSGCGSCSTIWNRAAT